MNARGFSVLEVLVVVAVIGLLAAFALPNVRAYTEEARIKGAADMFEGHFRKAGSTAIRSLVNTAIVFDGRDGEWTYAVYMDGNHNGVLRTDIRAGLDRLVTGPFPLTSGAPSVRVGINPGVPEIPPGRGILDPRDPIRFGNSNILSFSPLGTATPGTFYLAGRRAQAAVRVVAGTARVRLLFYGGGRWRER